jgi:ribosomal protein S18 acetylase RimI-like enzyme
LSEVLLVRPARDEDVRAAAALLYLTSPGGFTIFGGGSDGGRRLVEAAFLRPGTDTSREVVTVAELEGRLVGAMALFPAPEGPRRRKRFVRVALRRRAPWHWPRMLTLARRGAAHSPASPDDALYIDALATAEDTRRRGVARELLLEAERIARERGVGALALDTTATNSAARALYEAVGFEIAGGRAARPPMPEVVLYVKRL